MLTRSIDNIRDLGDKERPIILEQLVLDFGNNIVEWRRLKEADIAPWVEKELGQLTKKMEQRHTKARDQVDILSKQLQDIKSSKEEITIDFEVTQTRVSATIKDMDKANELIEKANKMIAQAQSILAKAQPLCDANAAHLDALSAKKAMLEKQEQETSQKLAEAEVLIEEVISIETEQLWQEAVAKSEKAKE